MEEKSLLVCMKIEWMKIKPNSKNTCSLCGATVGITKASEEQFAKAKNKQYICIECFDKTPFPFEANVMPISDSQKKELEDYLRKKNG